jgi:hypothetical protein
MEAASCSETSVTEDERYLFLNYGRKPVRFDPSKLIIALFNDFDSFI